MRSILDHGAHPNSPASQHLAIQAAIHACADTGGGTVADAARHDVPEMPQDYPEFPVFHPLPAWGLYLRHVRGARLSRVRLRAASPDVRPPLVAVDVEELVTEHFP